MKTLIRFSLFLALLLPCLLSATPPTQSFRVAPSYFPNKGQVSDKSVSWYSRGANVSLYLRGTTLTYVLHHRPKSASDDLMKRPHEMDETASIVDRVDVELVGANPRYEIQAEAKQAGVFHFYLPQCSPGLRDVPHYGRVVCRDVWPGVDLVLGAQGDALKYDFVVKPGADAGQIRLRYGGQGPNLAPDGGLTRPTAAGDLRESAPVAWTTAPDGSRKPVAASWQLAEDGQPRFALGAYDAKQPLTIDPVVWGMYVGGRLGDNLNSMCKMPEGGVFAGGSTESTNFVGLSGSYKGGDVDGFLARFSEAGDLVWGSYLGGGATDYVAALCPAPDGGVYAGGTTNSADFEKLSGGYKGENDNFLARFSADGELIHGVFLGGTKGELLYSLSPALDGGVYAGGTTRSNDFEGFSGDHHGGDNDGFLTRFSATCDLVWGKYLGGRRYDFVFGLCEASNGGVFVGGSTSSQDFEGLSGAYHGGGDDGFVAFFSTSGDLIWGKYIGGYASDPVYAICSAPDGGVFAAGATGSGNFEGISGNIHDTGDGYLVRFSAVGDFIFGKFLGGIGSELVRALCPDSNGGVFVGGETASRDFEGLDGGYRGGDKDGFLLHFSTEGDLISGSYLGGRYPDFTRALNPTHDGGVYVGGQTSSSNFEELRGFRGSNDGFLLKYSDAPTCSGLVSRTESSGIIEDGSGDHDYTDNLDCQWLIQPPNAGQIHITFESFSIEDGSDFVSVYDGPTTESPLIGRYTGADLPPVLVTTQGQALIVFTSDTSGADQGWSLRYESSGVARASAQSPLPLSFAPNPATDQAHISLNLETGSPATLEAYDAAGRLVHSRRLVLSAGDNRLELDLTGWPAGVYSVRLQTERGEYAGRLVKN